MTKMIKMSLVAAVAVAGFTSTASAKPVEDAIKNVDVSGMVRYRYTNGSQGAETNSYKTVLKISSKVNEIVTAKIKLAGSNDTTDVTGDADPVQANVKEANFVFNLGDTTVIAGKQGLATPFGDAADQQGTGVVVVKPLAKTLTLAAGWYTNSDAQATAANAADLNGNNITALALIGSTNAVNYALWGAKVSEGDINAGATAMNVNLGAKLGAVNVNLNHAQVKYEGTAGSPLGTQKLTKLVASTKAGAATVTAGYLIAGEDGGDVTLGDTDAAANFLMDRFSATALKDTTALYLGVSAAVAPKVTLGLDYGATSDDNGQVAGDVKVSETRFKAAYAMSKNFNVSGFVAKYEVGNDSDEKTRVELKYTF